MVRGQLSVISCQIVQLSDRTAVKSDNCQWTMDNCQRKLSVLWKNCKILQLSPLGTVAIYQRLVVAGGGFFLLLDLGPGAAACGMGIEINTGYSRGGGGFSDLHWWSRKGKWLLPWTRQTVVTENITSNTRAPTICTHCTNWLNWFKAATKFFNLHLDLVQNEWNLLSITCCFRNSFIFLEKVVCKRFFAFQFMMKIILIIVKAAL